VNLPLYIEITITTSMVEFKPYQLCTSGKFLEVTRNSGNGVEEEKIIPIKRSPKAFEKRSREYFEVEEKRLPHVTLL
jgi:hypothetical protein